MTAIRIGLKTGVTGDSGRWVEADLALPAHEGAPARSITVVSTYLHSGTRRARRRWTRSTRSSTT